jgi:uncharacterized protein
MTSGQKDLIELKLQRAEETLEEAKIMLDTEHYFGASNRVYYACFYAVSALLMTKNLSSSKHSGVIALFNKHFIKENVLPVELGKFYSRIFDNRQQSDYGDVFTIEIEELKNDFETAENLINKIKELTNSSI